MFMTKLYPNTKPSVLLADDDRLTCLMISKVLERNNFNVTTVENGLDAINLSKEQDFDYLITDIMMPGVEGIEVISEVLQYNPMIKIIAISSDGLVGHSTLLTLAKTMGASATIQKPVRADTLINTIESI